MLLKLLMIAPRPAQALHALVDFRLHIGPDPPRLRETNYWVGFVETLNKVIAFARSVILPTLRSSDTGIKTSHLRCFRLELEADVLPDDQTESFNHEAAMLMEIVATQTRL